MKFTKLAYVICADSELRCELMVDFNDNTAIEIREYQIESGVELGIGVSYSFPETNHNIYCMYSISVEELISKYSDATTIFVSDSYTNKICGSLCEPQHGRTFEELVSLIENSPLTKKISFEDFVSMF